VGTAHPTITCTSPRHAWGHGHVLLGTQVFRHGWAVVGARILFSIFMGANHALIQVGNLHSFTHLPAVYLCLCVYYGAGQSTLQFNMPEHSSLPAWVLLACGKAHITSDMHLDLLPTHMCFRHMEQQTRWIEHIQ